MADARIGSTRFFERGIDTVLGTPETPTLPELRDMQPATALQGTGEMDGLLSTPNLEAMLAAWVRPKSIPAELLTARRFRAVLQGAALQLRQAAQARRHVNPQLGKLVDRACRVLDEEIDLREQLVGRALIQG